MDPKLIKKYVSTSKSLQENKIIEGTQEKLSILDNNFAEPISMNLTPSI